MPTARSMPARGGLLEAVGDVAAARLDVGGSAVGWLMARSLGSWTAGAAPARTTVCGAGARRDQHAEAARNERRREQRDGPRAERRDAPPTCGVSRKPGSAHSGCPAGSGSGSITSSAAGSRPLRTSASRASVSTTRAAGDVDDQGAVRQRGRGTPRRPAHGCASVIGTVRTTTSCSGSSAGSSSIAVDAVPGPGGDAASPRPRSPAAGARPPGPRRRSRPAAPVRSASEVPNVGAHSPGGLAADVGRDAAQRRDRQADRELGGRRVVHAARVGQRHAVGRWAARPRSRRSGLDQPQVRQLGQPVQGRPVAEVRRHHDLDRPGPAAARSGPRARTRTPAGQRSDVVDPLLVGQAHGHHARDRRRIVSGRTRPVHGG